jgi:hypothetical protein
MRARDSGKRTPVSSAEATACLGARIGAQPRLRSSAPLRRVANRGGARHGCGRSWLTSSPDARPVGHGSRHKCSGLTAPRAAGWRRGSPLSPAFAAGWRKGLDENGHWNFNILGALLGQPKRDNAKVRAPSRQLSTPRKLANQLARKRVPDGPRTKRFLTQLEIQHRIEKSMGVPRRVAQSAARRAVDMRRKSSCGDPVPGRGIGGGKAAAGNTKWRI